MAEVAGNNRPSSLNNLLNPEEPFHDRRFPPTTTTANSFSTLANQSSVYVQQGSNVADPVNGSSRNVHVHPERQPYVHPIATRPDPQPISERQYQSNGLPTSGASYDYTHQHYPSNRSREYLQAHLYSENGHQQRVQAGVNSGSSFPRHFSYVAHATLAPSIEPDRFNHESHDQCSRLSVNGNNNLAFSQQSEGDSGNHVSEGSYPQIYHSSSTMSDSPPLASQSRSKRPVATYDLQLGDRASVRLAAQQGSRSSSPFPGEPATGQKRRSPDGDVASPGPKRVKKQSTKSTSTAKRGGYSASKRREVAQLAGHNSLEYISPVRYDFLGAPISVPNLSDAHLINKYSPELQTARCMSNKYRHDPFSRCVSCTRRWQGDTCRFQGIRYFLRDEANQITRVTFAGRRTPDEPKMNFPVHWNQAFTDEHIRITRVTTARALVNVLEEELKHLSDRAVIYRRRESEVRATCDTCMTSLFCGTWMCRICGREACPDCFATIKNLTQEFPPGTEDAEQLRARRDHLGRANPFFLTCQKRTDHQMHHFNPVSRFTQEELQDAVEGMKASILEADEPSANIPISKPVEHPTVIPDPSVANGPVPSYDIPRYADGELTPEKFRQQWATGMPLVVSGLLHKFRKAWTPGYFREAFGDQGCLIIECQTDENMRVTIGDFFKMFGQYEGREKIWKLKDWPPSTDFKTGYPDLFEDFNQVIPMPDYVRRDGVMNISAHFPTNTISPDLGPKMYNALASSEREGSKGSTKLHMDMSDAMNIMTHASQKEDGTEGCAVWDLFQACDSNLIRRFIRESEKERNPSKPVTQDPIHGQQFYLDEVLRKELYLKYGVKSFRVYQTPGDAVFIPAGCAHQVCNLSDCIKVAIDFVSPENISRCEQLTREFRGQNYQKAWKEDVLQLRSMMWFAWLSCERLLKEREGS